MLKVDRQDLSLDLVILPLVLSCSLFVFLLAVVLDGLQLVAQFGVLGPEFVVLLAQVGYLGFLLLYL